MTELDRVRARFYRILLAAGIANIILAGLAAHWLGGQPMLPFVTLGGLFLLPALVGMRLNGSGAFARTTMALSHAGLVSLIVAAAAGHPYQPDIHMYYFATLAVVACLFDLRAILAYTGFVAVQHLGLTMLMPTLLLPGGTDIARVMIHAVILLAEAGMLGWLALILPRSLLMAEEATAHARVQATRAEELLDQQQKVTAELDTREGELRAAIAAFRAEFAEIMNPVDEGITRLSGTAERLRAFSKATHAKADEVGHASQATADSVNSISATTEELSASVGEINGQIGSANGMVEKAAHTADETSGRISSLAEAASAIGEVVTMIQNVAEQTNLLALNATIEAARAGEAGKGFAVVAAEVKELAGQTARATEEISARIEGIQESTGAAVSSISEITGLLQELAGYTASLSAAASQQGAAAGEIAGNVARAAGGARQVAGAMQDMSQSAADANESSQDVASVAEELNRHTGNLRQSIERFLARVA